AMSSGSTLPPGFARLESSDLLHDLLRESEFVAVCCPWTKETNHLIGRAAFAAMKRGRFWSTLRAVRLSTKKPCCRLWPKDGCAALGAPQRASAVRGDRRGRRHQRRKVRLAFRKRAGLSTTMSSLSVRNDNTG